MDHYKSWSGLNKWLSECLCEELKGSQWGRKWMRRDQHDTSLETNGNPGWWD